MRPEASSMQAHAEANLRYIRATLEHAGAFSAVPGRGGMAMGVTALIASLVASRQPDERSWFLVWLLEAVVALAIGGVSLLAKVRRSESSLRSVAFRRFALAYAPPMIAGAAITFYLRAHGLYAPLPAVWLLLYGAAVTAGGAMSVRVVPVMGALFMLTGMLTFFLPLNLGNWMMAASFGLLHFIFGLIIARHHGG